MTTVAMQDIRSLFRVNAGSGDVYRDKHTTLVNSTFVIFGIVFADAMVGEEAGKSTCSSADGRTS